MKRLTALVLVLTICLGLCSVTASAASIGVDAGKQVQTNSYGAETSGEDSDAPINGNLLLGREYTVAFDGSTVADDGIKATDGKFRGDGESAWNGNSKGDASVEWMGTGKTVTYTFTFDTSVNLNEIVFKRVRIASNRQFGTLIINDNLMFLANEVVKTPVADAPLYVQNSGEEGVDQYFDVSVNIEYYDVTELKIQVITDAYCCQYDEIEAYGTIAEQPVPEPDVSWDETEEPAYSEVPSEPDVSWDETEEPAYSEYPSEPDYESEESVELPSYPCYSEHGTIESDHPYSNNMELSWYVYCKGAECIFLEFSEDTFTERNYDYITIYDDVNDSFYASYSGDELAGRTIAVYSNDVTVRLITDGSVTEYGFSANVYAGFSDEAACDDAYWDVWNETVVGDTSEEPAYSEEPEELPSYPYNNGYGTIESNHPYSDNMELSWYVYCEGAECIFLEFSEDTFTEWGFDYITIFDNVNDWFERYNGNELAGRTIAVYSNDVTVRLTTDGSATEYGFSAFVYAGFSDEAACVDAYWDVWSETVVGDTSEEPAYSEYPSEPDVSWDETEEPAYSEYPSEPDVSWEDSYEDSIEEPFEGETSIGDIVVVRENLVLDKPYTLTTSDGTISYYSPNLGDHSNPPTVGSTMEIWQGQVTDGVYRAGTEENRVKDAAAGVTLELAGTHREYYYTFDLGAEKSVSSVVLRVAKAYGNRSANIIKVEVSDDGEAWTSVNFLRLVEVVPYSEQGDINYGTTEAPDMRYMMFNILATFNEVNATYVRVSLDTTNPCPDYCYVESAGADRGYILQFDEIEVYGGEPVYEDSSSEDSSSEDSSFEDSSDIEPADITFTLTYTKTGLGELSLKVSIPAGMIKGTIVLETTEKLSWFGYTGDEITVIESENRLVIGFADMGDYESGMVVATIKYAVYGTIDENDIIVSMWELLDTPGTIFNDASGDVIRIFNYYEDDIGDSSEDSSIEYPSEPDVSWDETEEPAYSEYPSEPDYESEESVELPSYPCYSEYGPIDSDHPYSNNMELSWYVYCKGAECIFLDFSGSTYTEGGWDYITIYDNVNDWFERYSGNELAGRTIAVYSNDVTVRLTTDSSVTEYGFYAHVYAGFSDEAACGDAYWDVWNETVVGDTSEEPAYSEYPSEPDYESEYPSEPDYESEEPVDNSTEYYYTDEDGMPESEHNYKNHTDKSWHIIREGADSVSVTFSADTFVEDGWDYIYIYDGNRIQQGRYTGSSLSGVTVTVAGDTLQIRLTSDYSNTYYGFSVTDISINNPVSDDSDDNVSIGDIVTTGDNLVLDKPYTLTTSDGTISYYSPNLGDHSNPPTIGSTMEIWQGQVTDGVYRAGTEENRVKDAAAGVTLELTGTFREYYYTFDLGAEKSVSSVVLRVAKAYGNRSANIIKVEVSDDGEAWTSVNFLKLVEVVPYSEQGDINYGTTEAPDMRYMMFNILATFNEVNATYVRVSLDTTNPCPDYCYVESAGADRGYIIQFDEIEVYGGEPVYEDSSYEDSSSEDSSSEDSSSEDSSTDDSSTDDSSTEDSSTEDSSSEDSSSEDSSSEDDTSEEAPSEDDVTEENSSEDDSSDEESSDGDFEFSVDDSANLDDYTGGDNVAAGGSPTVNVDGAPGEGGDKLTDGSYRGDGTLGWDTAPGTQIIGAGTTVTYTFNFANAAKVVTIVFRNVYIFDNASFGKLYVNSDVSVSLAPQSAENGVEVTSLRYIPVEGAPDYYNVVAEVAIDGATELALTLITNKPLCQFDEIELYTAEEEVLMGDVNGDGSINSLDAAQILRHDAQLLTLEGAGLAAADVNGDGAVNSLDAAMILRFDAGLITEF